MKNMKLTMAALALLAAAIFTPSAKAVPAAVDGDLILGIYDTSGTVINSLEVNLGLLKNLTAGETFVLAPDITAVFGTTTTLDFAIATTGGTLGANGLVAREIQVTTLGTLVDPGTSTPTTNINNEINGFATGTQEGTTPEAVSIANSNSRSFDTEVHNSSSSDYGLASSAPLGVLAPYTAGTEVTLYDAKNLNPLVTPEGEFLVGFNGTSLTFLGVPIETPEPSTYALALCGAALLVVLVRRRSVV